MLLITDCPSVSKVARWLGIDLRASEAPSEVSLHPQLGPNTLWILRVPTDNNLKDRGQENMVAAPLNSC